MRLILLLYILKVTAGCPQITSSAYRNSDHLSSMNLSILYDEDFFPVASSVACHLEGIFKATNLIPLPKTSNISGVCDSEEFQKLTRRLGLIRVTVTISNLNGSAESEKKCNTTGNVLHLKMVEGRWLAHLLTARSDFIMEVGPINGSGLWKASEVMLALAGPVLTFPRRAVYKSMHEEEVKRKKESSAWVEWLVGTGVASLLLIATAMAAVLGKVAENRRNRRRQEKGAQLADKASMTIGDGSETTETTSTRSDVADSTQWSSQTKMASSPLLTTAKTLESLQSDHLSNRNGVHLDDIVERAQD